MRGWREHLAQVYGYQGTKEGTSSESILGRLIRRAPDEKDRPPLVVGTKFFPGEAADKWQRERKAEVVEDEDEEVVGGEDE